MYQRCTGSLSYVISPRRFVWFFFFLFNKNSWTEHRWIREKIFFFTIEKDRWSNSKNLFYFSRRRRFFYHWLYALDFSFFFQMIWSRLKTIYREFITFLIERKYQYVLYISKRRIIITRNHFYDNKQLLCMYANRKVARSFPYTIKNNAIRMRYNYINCTLDACFSCIE